MSEDVTEKPAEAEDPSQSPLSVRLQVSTPIEPIVVRPLADREETAKKRVGTRIKGWRLVSLLGVGPITSAYEVIHGEKDSGERGVMRLLTSDGARNERAKQQYLRAAYAANRFRHPRVVSIASDGLDDAGAPYVIRTHYEAKTLRTVVREQISQATEHGHTRRGLEINRVLRIMEQVLDALEIAHAHGVVHGAITPDNVLVTPRGSIRLVDFSTPPGAAQAVQDVRDVFADARVGPFTAPERCMVPVQPPNEQTDIWGLAACAYYALTGQYPRGEETRRAELATMTAIPLRQVSPQAPETVAQMLDHALALEPEQRYGSAYAMLGDVRRALAGRKPKLGDALRPVPSGSYRDVSLPSSKRVIVTDSSAPRPPTSNTSLVAPTSSLKAKRRNEWRGNFILIFAIALLVGVATFVVVRERMEEERQPPHKSGTP